MDGDPCEADQASAAVPGVVIFPVQSNERTLVDGGVLTIVPVRFVRAMGKDLIIAIEIYCNKPSALRGNALDTVLKTFRLRSCLLSEAETAEADILVRPAFEPDNPVSFSQRDKAIVAGYRAAATMKLHIGYESVEPFKLQRANIKVVGSPARRHYASRTEIVLRYTLNERAGGECPENADACALQRHDDAHGHAACHCPT